jgi:threonine dehydrogenase-like Zn-dependent dehydrogenase
MQAVRRAQISLGERVAVIGCGPLGLLAVQMLHASGCRVFATDLDSRRLAIAKDFGAEQAVSPEDEDIVIRATHWSGGMGVDAAIVFTATSSGEPVSQAFRMARRKGRVVLAGVAGGEYKRDVTMMNMNCEARTIHTRMSVGLKNEIWRRISICWIKKGSESIR